MTPLHLAAVSDGSGSPVPTTVMPLAAAPLSGMLLPVGSAGPQDMAVVLAVSGGMDPSNGVQVMPTETPPGSGQGSPQIATASLQATHLGDDSDSDSGYRTPMLEGVPAGACAAGMPPWPPMPSMPPLATAT
jgi:hypothetical protein